MKTLLFILLLFTPLTTYAQTVNNPFGNSSVIPVETKSSKSIINPQKTSKDSSIDTNTKSCNQVWVNKNTHIYHTQNDKWYGKTKNGNYMCEEQAINDGFRKAKRN